MSASKAHVTAFQLKLLLTCQLCMIFLNVLLCLREVTQSSACESLLSLSPLTAFDSDVSRV